MPFLAILAVAVVALAAGREENSLRVPVWAPAGVELTGEQLHVKVDGKKTKILGVRGPEAGLMLLVILDVAGDLSLVEPARQALTAGMDKAPENVYAGLLRAQDGLQVVLDPTAAREDFRAAVDAQAVGGRAGLLNTVDTVTRLADAIAGKADVRLAALYISDSNIHNYREDYTNPVVNSSDSRDLSRRFPEGLVKEKIARLLASVAARQTPLFIVHLDYRSDRLNEAYQTGLLELATATGGTAEFCRSVGEIPAAVSKTLEAILTHWSVEVELPEKAAKQATVAVEAQETSLRYRSRFLLQDK